MSTALPLPQPSIKNTATLVNDFLDNCRYRNLSKETLRYYADFLIKFAREYPELPDRPQPLEQFILHFQSSDARRHGAFRAVRAFYNWIEARYQLTNAMKAVGSPRVRPKEKPALTIEQLRKLLDYPLHRPVIRALLYFLADTGVRIGEAANLYSEDIFPDSVRVRGKTGERIIPISPEVRELLLQLGPGKVFPGKSHRLSELVTRAGKVAGVKVCAHDLRRTFATNWRGSDLSLKYIGGWSSWKMVEHYSQRRLDKARDDHIRFSPIAVMNDNGDQEHKIIIHFSENGKMNNPPESIQPLDTVVELAEELGATKEKLSQKKRQESGEELKDFITAMPGMKGNINIAMAKFAFHSTLYNFAMQFIEENISAWKRGNVWTDLLEGSLPFVFDKSLKGQDVPRAIEDDSESIIRFIKLLTGNMIILARGFAEEQLTKAIMYRELMGIEQNLEVFNFYDEGE